MTSPKHAAKGLTRRAFTASAIAAASAGRAGARGRTILNDASLLSPTPVAKHVVIKRDGTADAIAALRAELAEARRENRPFLVSAARHSMGGQSLPRDGTAVTVDGIAIEADRSAMAYRISAGARWSQAIAALDKIGMSPAVMQSNSDFGIGSTLSVNAHGWPVPYGPFGSTVRAFRMILSDGSLVTCSPSENAELFGLAIGGYGLFGAIVDIDLDMVRNQLMRPTMANVRPADFGTTFARQVGSGPVAMGYGRLSVARASLFDEAVMITFAPEARQPERLPAATSSGAMTGISRRIYRGQTGSEAGKRIRWYAESTLAPMLGDGAFTRNSLMNEPASNLASSDSSRTDILHEYFLPPDRLREFIGSCRGIIPKARAEFLNVTLRYVGPDDRSALAYAPEPRIGAVMSFSQEISPKGEVDMMELTERLVDAALDAGGSYYLPYRLHARQDQFLKAYPKAGWLAERKRHYDPSLTFRNALWAAHLA